MTEARDLEPLFAPASVAVLGASTDPSKWGNWLARNALRGAHRRPVHLINRRGGEIDGHPLLTSLAEAGEPVETVVVSVPEAGLEQAVEESLAQGARALIVITAGLAEKGEAGRKRERALVARVREAGAVMLGPNCIGVYDALAEFHVSSNDYPAGPVGLISQSGNLSIELGMLLERCGLGLSRFASIGNQADVRLPDLVEHLAGHEPTRAIAIYAEDVADGRAFVEAARAAARRKPVILLNSGRSAAGARGAASHTGALVSSDAVIAAACREAGIVRVDSPGELVDACLAFVRSPRARGRRVAVIADGGGHGSVAADLLTANGLEVPSFSSALVAQIEPQLLQAGGIGNPIDIIDGADGLASFTGIARSVLASGEVDAVLLSGYFGGYALYSDEYRTDEPREATALAALQGELDRPLVVHSLFADAVGEGTDLRAHGLAAYERSEQAARACAALATPAPEAALAQPATAEPLSGAPGYVEARALLLAAGIPYGEGGPARDADEAVALADELGLYPATLKAVDARLVHKSDAGGVCVGLADATDLRAAALDMRARLAPELLFVERTADVRDGVELVVGATRDARFGAVVLVGLGGILVETLRDTALALAPLDAAGAERLLRSLRASPLLDGVRGRPAVDVAAAARAVVALGAAMAAHPEIAELEVNPLLVTPHGAIALDARVALADGPTPTPNE
ncbi:MAG TPA: acetate--CoA ligase family protein [Gaiellales bacterium]